VATDFDLDGAKGEQIPEINIVEEDVQSTNLAAEILCIHHRMGHAPFSKIQEMARQGALPARFKNCPIPMCTACAYGKASRKAWRGKLSKKGAGSRTNLRAGELVSVDQMVSPIPGLVAQITGTLTTKRYNYATVYADQATRLGYVHLQKGATAEETLEGKKAFEAYARDHGISIKAYHADNGIFRAHKWVDCCKTAEQGLTFAGVNSHHENGITERRIKELQDLARTMLIHANRRWKTSVNAHLWPYAVRMASEQINNMPRMQSKERNPQCRISPRRRPIRTSSIGTRSDHRYMCWRVSCKSKGYLVSGKPGQILEYTLVDHPTTAEMLRLSSTGKQDW
jgi:hypothetical protein